MGKKSTAIIIIVLLVLAGSAGGWYFLKYKPEQEAKEKARLEQIALEQAEQKRKEQAAQKKADYEKLVKIADSEFEKGNWVPAQSNYSEASALFPNESYPKDQLALVNAKLEEQARRAAGVVEKVTEPTERFYVIISSSIDDDLAMDYANKLAKEGNIVKVIEPYASNKLFYRVSLGDYASLEEAENASQSFNNYGDGIWVLKY